LSFAKVLVQTTQEISAKKKRKKRVRRVDNRFNHFKEVQHNPDEWNIHDIITYYQLLHRSMYGYQAPVSIARSSGQISFFCRNFMRKSKVVMQDVKLAMQIYFSIIADAPPSIGFMTNARAIHDIKEHWDAALSRKVSDEYVLGGGF
jgi:hypothetical protein